LFEAHVRPVVEAGTYQVTERMMYLIRVKPGS
jgi:hypothetical protein